jgi:transcriptional regulator with GAF, ATPase, and Fis domain
MSSYATLFEIGKSLFAETDISKLLPLAMDKVIEQAHAERGMIVVYGKADEILVETARHFDKKDLAHPDFEISRTIIQQVRASGRPVVVQNALDDPQYHRSESIARLRLLSVACAPLRVGNEIFGVVYIDNRDLTAVFDDETGKLLNEFCELIAVAVKNALERRRLESEAAQKDLKLRHETARRRHVEALMATHEGYDEIKGLKSPAMLEIVRQIEKVAATDSSVLIIGETGAGKELIARVLHRKSARAEQSFVTLNCAGLPNEDLLISELFGHIKGAFTGATSDKAGYFETADGGTIFLDEIAKSTLTFQTKLLRVLESGEFNRLGETNRLRKTDVRIISAASPNLPELMQKGEFYPDLYYRLEHFVIHLPPLRERREDILEIAEHFLKQFAKTHKRTVTAFSGEARELLLSHRWPGNVRELRNAVNRAVILAEGETIQVEDLPLTMLRQPAAPSADQEINFNLAKQRTVEKFEREFIAARLRETKGNISEAARRSGMHKKNFIQKMQQYGITKENLRLSNDRPENQ